MLDDGKYSPYLRHVPAPQVVLAMAGKLTPTSWWVPAPLVPERDPKVKVSPAAMAVFEALVEISVATRFKTLEVAFPAGVR